MFITLTAEFLCQHQYFSINQWTFFTSG